MSLLFFFIFICIVYALGDVRVSLYFNSDINFIEKGATGYKALIGHQGAVNGCYYSRNTGTVFTYGGDGRVLEWTSGEAHVIAVSIILINHS